MQLIKKNADGYGYKYTDLAQITKLLAENEISYYQEIETTGDNDYIITVIMDKDGNEVRRVRGCRIVNATLSGKSNPAQEYGAALTYCRRYSLLMAFGLATTDDDAESLTRPAGVTEKEIAAFEATCKLFKVDPQSLFTGKSYKDMTPAEYAKGINYLKGLKK